MKNLQIQINGVLADIDGDTAVAFTYRGFSFSEAGSLHLSNSNTFSLPLTSKNRKIFSFADSVYVNSAAPTTDIYEKYDVKFFIDGQAIFSGRAYVDNIGSRIELYVINGMDVIQALTNMTMEDATDLAVTNLNALLDETYESGATFQDIVAFLVNGDNGAWLPYSVGSLSKQMPEEKIEDGITSLVNAYDDDSSNNLETESLITLEFVTNSDVVGDYKSGQIFVNVKDLLSWIFASINVTVSYDSDVEDELSEDFVRMQDLLTYQDLLNNKYMFMKNTHYLPKIEGDDEVSSKSVKVIDFLKTVCQEYALTFDIVGDTMTFFSFNNVKDKDTLTLKGAKVISNKFYIDGIPQTSYIGYSSLKGDGSDASTTGGVLLTCNNKNIDEGSDETIAFSIKRALVGYFTYEYEESGTVTNTYALDLTDTSLDKEIVIIRKSASSTPYYVTVQRYYNGVATMVTAQMIQATQSTVSSNGYYDLFAQNVLYPQVMEIEAYVSSYQMNRWSTAKLVEFEGIPGTFYVTKVSDWNPALEGQTLTMTAMRIR